MRKNVPALSKQGEADGLCGIYALVSFVADRVIIPQRQYKDYANDDFSNKKDENTRRVFREIMYAADRIGLVNSVLLVDGYPYERLSEIFLEFCREASEKGSARPLEAVARSLKNTDIFEVAKAVCDDNTSILAHIDSEAHWVLIVSASDKRLRCYDSALGRVRYLDREAKDTATIGVETGLVLTLG